MIAIVEVFTLCGSWQKFEFDIDATVPVSTYDTVSRASDSFEFEYLFSFYWA